MRNIQLKDKKMLWEKPSVQVLKLRETEQTNPFTGGKDPDTGEQSETDYTKSPS